MAFHYSPKIVTDGLIFALDAGNHKSYPGSGTVWTDLSGNSNHGTLTNGPTFNSANNGSIVFDGVNDYVDCGIIKPTGAMTISFWFKGKSASTSISGVGALAADRGYLMGVNNSNSWKFYIAENASTLKLAAGTLTIDESRWYNIVGVYIPSTSITLYVNGNSLAENTTSIPAAQYVGNGVSTKIANRGDGYYFDGNITNVSIYDIALTQSDITQNYNAIKSRFGL